MLAISNLFNSRCESLENFANVKLSELEGRSLRRKTLITERRDCAATVLRGGKTLLSFSSNDYLNLSVHPDVIAAIKSAAERYGGGAGASYLVTGYHPLYEILEARLAKFKRTEDACVFGSGFLANIGIIAALAARNDLIIIDEFSHACMWAGARLSTATLRVFKHNDVDHVERLLADRAKFSNVLFLTEGVFSMDGDRGLIGPLADAARRYDAWLLVDDAHAVGTIGAGRGTSFSEDGSFNVPLQMGTLSKALGNYGGYLCASRPVIELVKNRARSFVYSTALPPPVIAGAIAALTVIEASPSLTEVPISLARRFTRALSLPDAVSPIVPIVVGSAERSLRMQHALEDLGFLVVAIRPPTVPEHTSRLRVSFTAAHSEADVDALAHALLHCLND